MENERECFVVGVTGPVGAGVSTVTKIMSRKLDFDRVSLSAPIKVELRKRMGMPSDSPINESTCTGFRKKLQEIGNEMREKDPTHWVKEAIKRVDHKKPFCIDGIRNLQEVLDLRKRYHRFFLAAVSAFPEQRWKRLKEQYNGNEKQFADDDERDKGEGLEFGQQVSKCVDHADYVIDNNEQLIGGQVENHIEKILKGDIPLMENVDGTGSATNLRPPRPEEGHMAAAYAESHISQCLKRHVGAVIVSEDARVLSTGYNENPRDMLPCTSKWGSCYKDDNMHERLTKMVEIHCPKCGKKHEQIEKPWLCNECGESIKRVFFPNRNLSLCTAVHAEELAILSLDGRDASGGTIFSTTFPCFQCARKIIDYSLRKVVYVEAYPVLESKALLESHNVIVEPFQGFKARAFNLVFRQVE